MQKKPYIITVCSGKGGVGKSVLTGNLAYTLSKSQKVLIWDADVYFPNQHFLIGVEPPIRLNDIYEGKVGIESAIYQITDNLYLLAETPASIKSSETNKTSLVSVMNELITNTDFDFLLIDTPGGNTYETLESCSISDMICIVITDEPTSLIDAYALIKIIMPYIDTDKIRLLVNNVIDFEDAEDISVKLNLATDNFLKIKLEVLGFVPYDRIVRQSILQQELFTKNYTDTEVTKAIEGISVKLINSLKNNTI